MTRTGSAMDMVIGAGEAQRNASQGSLHSKNALAALEKDDRPTAIAELRKACAADPRGDYFFRLAYLLDITGQEDEAIAMYERVRQSLTSA